MATLLISANGLVATPAIYGNAPHDRKTAFQPVVVPLIKKLGIKAE